jgi:hypothetical protein
MGTTDPQATRLSSLATKMQELASELAEATETSTSPSEDTLSELIDALAAFKEASREVIADADRAILEALDRTQDGVAIGEVRWYAGLTYKYTRLVDHDAVYNAIVEHNTRNQDLAIEPESFFSSSAWKEGALRDYLPEKTFGQLFDRIAVLDKKTGRPKRSAHHSNARFMKGLK